MPPDTPFRPHRILEILARHRVQHVVIGAYAAVLAGAEVLTRDLDITPGLEPSNLQRLAEALQELHAAIRVPNEPPVPLPADGRLLARAEIWNLTTDAGDLDISVRPDGTSGYEDLRRAAHRQPARRRPVHHGRGPPGHHPEQDRRRPSKGSRGTPGAARRTRAPARTGAKHLTPDRRRRVCCEGGVGGVGPIGASLDAMSPMGLRCFLVGSRSAIVRRPPRKPSPERASERR